ncbi:MAG TPA: ABC transporter permease [Solirubrobacteraceae bacterium]|nr:ABC transporter permease [Solirubrobacteraceae bacterium]
MAVRLVLAVVTLIAISIIVFAATQILPGDAARAKLGKQATPAAIAALRVQLGLNHPAIQQYWDWARGLLGGNLGTSLTSGRPISQSLSPLIENSGFLVLVAAAISIPLSLLIGCLTALRRDGIIDEIAAFLQRTLASIPEFVIGLFLIALFATSVLRLFPAISIIPPGDAPWDHLSEIWLPALTLVAVVTPNIALIMRASMVEVLESEYIEMARLKGVPERQVVLRNALPNALGPAFQVIALNLAYLAGGIIVVESVFSYSGIGVALRDAVLNRDFTTTQVITMIIAAVYVLTNLLADVATLLVTPRMRTRL